MNSLCPKTTLAAPLQAREVAAAMRDLNIDIIVTSPFKRCLQTSAEIAAELGTPQGAWLVDWGLSEVGGPGACFLHFPLTDALECKGPCGLGASLGLFAGPWWQVMVQNQALWAITAARCPLYCVVSSRGVRGSLQKALIVPPATGVRPPGAHARPPRLRAHGQATAGGRLDVGRRHNAGCH
jgi:hypothetical protein